jgi:hypothetical protein|tara:strand:- start:8976 stop:9353 length:378 start_codon:yes stop_codon:yes gene_type:complete
MKKIIDIPNEIVKELKILAVKDDTDLKNYIQNLISMHHKYSNITEMAGYGIEDGQSTRFVWNYLVDTYEGIKGETFDHDDFKYDSLVHFLEDVKETCAGIIFSMKMDPESEYYDEEYEKQINEES